ncbi:DUF5313 domain-containing protein [Mycolicibacterium brumae]|uniref:DUF5313 domain-containing protein n=1 Tax=Mycolicibacterium brumae TaxID=85968 RepID=A0A2G5P6I4_9MYCO|nr:DUF5313 domain-containing protein [Mycolicibacterium brumae]MCV7191236.1 DUF5313 domain-containing protein [Mycolicibacterium brumae]PIB73710.1 hypothetical protein CQY22_015685 [Mycolicibacterium brumae]RWA19588.1 hypothetical protein MBRU_16655 [Mycolicibacterium brumae DSM 44177]UWW08326.1 DUF5313 domain-containing protein [Mycolicibacterium brumae]
MTDSATPNAWQRLAYIYGRRLPASMRGWVKQDLTGPGAVRRHMIRMAIPSALVLAPLWLLDAPVPTRIEMTVPIFIWALLMAMALNKPWRRHRLAQNGLDMNLIDTRKSKRALQMEANYLANHGPRPEEARWQSNSSPF